MEVLRYSYLFVLVVAFALGLPCLIVAVSIHRRSSRSRELSLFLWFYSAFILKMLVYTVEVYASSFLDQPSLFTEVVLEYASYIASVFLFLSLVRFVHRLFGVAFERVGNVIVLSVSAAALVSLFMPYAIGWDHARGDLTLRAGFYVLEIVFYAGVIYAIAIGLAFRRNLAPGNVRRMIRSLLIVAAGFTPLIVLEEFSSSSLFAAVLPAGLDGYAIFFPLYYLAFNAVLSYQGLKHNLFYSLELINTNVSDGFVSEYQITAREREIIDLIARGLSNQEIGETLYVSYQTVKNHVYNIFQKVSVSSRMELLGKVAADR